MSQEHSKAKPAKASEKRSDAEKGVPFTSSRFFKVVVYTYIFLLNVVVLIFFMMYLDAKGKPDQAQIKRIAQSYAIEQCLSKNNPKFNCASIKMDEPKPVGFEFGYIDVPHWNVGYTTTKGDETDAGLLYFDRSGAPLSLEELDQ